MNFLTNMCFLQPSSVARGSGEVSREEVEDEEGAEVEGAESAEVEDDEGAAQRDGEIAIGEVCLITLSTGVYILMLFV